MIMRRILWVTESERSETRANIGERALGWSVMFSGVRCILQYAILPFVLPLIGISMEVATPLLMVITGIAIISIVFSLRRFWKINYRYRWHYLALALVALVILTLLLLQDLKLIEL
ncbi:MAG: hypothetical protein SNJ59_04065 [Aggregatilineales bacterium]